MKLYLIRHGETNYNLQGIVQGGGVDSDLNETGIAQGRAFFEAYQHIPFEKVYCSSLKRTYQTLHGFVNRGDFVVKTPELDEFSWGELEGRSASPETKAYFREVTDAWARGELHVGMKDGENPIGAWERSRPFFERLMENYTQGNILICSHGRILRIMLSQLLGYPLAGMALFHHHNTGVNVLNITPNGKVTVELLNDVSHLEQGGVGVNVINYR
ncbi:MAG: histidine phosphatase family protein [Bacteroidia bacterium]